MRCYHTQLVNLFKMNNIISLIEIASVNVNVNDAAD